MLHSLPILELRSQPQGRVEGIAATFGGIDSYGDTLLPGAFAKSLSEHAAAGTVPVMLFAHDQAVPVGRWQKLDEDSRGLHVVGALNLKTAAGKDAFEHLHAGDLSGLSIGYTVPAGGSRQRGDVRELSAVKLHEVSLVTLAADSGARVTGVKSAAVKPQTMRELQAALQTLGFSRREAARISEKGFGDSEPDESDLSQNDVAAIASALRSLKHSLKGNP